uniref:Uncharacterized protein n=1 Tax=Acrobeloides nanus TaxID=290746 RepID=A0A914DPF6_9BILA
MQSIQQGGRHKRASTNGVWFFGTYGAQNSGYGAQNSGYGAPALNPEPASGCCDCQQGPPGPP